MSRKMLIDAASQKVLRVVITNNGTIEEFDYQNTIKKPTKGNIYLAKVTRVEHSLQAAFVDYGADRHGFLPFAEIHPDYYQLPVADREKLLEEIKNARKEQENRAEQREQEKKKNSKHQFNTESDPSLPAKTGITETPENEPGSEQITTFNSASTSYSEPEEDYERPQFYKRYKIQEVIKKDQVILVQIEKEERSNKGAALTSYISLAGRYCVLMPNATKGGGVSRKVDDEQDRDRLKGIAKELTNELGGYGAVIIRTAGAYKTRTEIKRDFGYLQKLWDNIRQNTVKSNAPTFIHEEGDVIKKAIRDLYDSDISQILIEGEAAFNDAQRFMKLILPKHVGKISLYQDSNPLFVKYGVEQQISSFYSNQVSLRSGGYLVINQTEALVAIDVNSGRATSERNIESTATRTNIEAAYEVAKQVRMRDLSGLIVIDFIDMEESRNKRSVEKALKEALAFDKAKIQMSRISPFGLLEMSRQRIRQSFIESNTEICEHCQGRGRTRSLEATASVVLRAIENEIVTMNKNNEILVSGSSKLMFYLMNKKRHELAKLETKHPEKIIFYIDESAGGDGFFIENKQTPKSSYDVRALSGIDQASVETSESIEDTTSLPSSHKHSQHRNQPGRMRFKKSKPSSNISHPQHHYKEQPEFENAQPPQPREFDNSRKFGRDNEDRSNRFKKKKEYFKKDHNHNHDKADKLEELNELNFDKEMAERRKDNQSLLKEIWKKIVD